MADGGSVHLRRVCVFCGASAGARPAYAEAARAVGTLLAERGIELVFGGGRVGLMGIVADACLAAGGHVIGIIPEALQERELGHTGIQDLRIVPSMHVRKQTMAELSDAFLALPGGVGTFEELIEAFTWTQLEIHKKPCGLLDVEGYYAGLRAQLDRALEDGFVPPQNRAILSIESDPAALLERLARYEHPPADRWMPPRP